MASKPVLDPRDDEFYGLLPGHYRVLKPATWHWPADKVQAIEDRVSRALRGYPELAGCTVNVGVMHDSQRTRGRADWYNHLIKFPANDAIPSRVTVWHEVAHVACHTASNDGRDYAYSSEEFTSILAVSRMPARLIDESRVPYVHTDPSVPRERYPDVCRGALAYRADRGPNSHYIQRCREWLDDIDAFRRSGYSIHGGGRRE